MRFQFVIGTTNYLSKLAVIFFFKNSIDFSDHFGVGRGYRRVLRADAFPLNNEKRTYLRALFSGEAIFDGICIE